MTSSVLSCEACGARHPFVLSEPDVHKLQGGGTLTRHCPACRTITNWKFAFDERRAGAERRSGERRSPPSR